MFNLIKMDLYRMVHSVSFKVMMVVVIAVAFFTIGMTSYDVKSMQEQPDSVIYQEKQPEESSQLQVKESEDGPKFTFEVGFTMDTDYGWGNKAPFGELINENIKSRLLLLLCVIFVPLFVNAEYKNGYIKNIAGQLPDRGKLVISKLAAVAVQVLILFAGYIFWSAIAGKIFFGDSLVFEDMGDLLASTVIHYVLCLATGYVSLMLTIVSRGSALPLTFGILCSTTFTALLYSGINVLISTITGNNTFDIGLYTPEMNVGLVTFDMTSGDLTRILLVGCTYAVLAAVIAVRVMKKRDV